MSLIINLFRNLNQNISLIQCLYALFLRPPVKRAFSMSSYDAVSAFSLYRLQICLIRTWLFSRSYTSILNCCIASVSLCTPKSYLIDELKTFASSSFVSVYNFSFCMFIMSRCYSFC